MTTGESAPTRPKGVMMTLTNEQQKAITTEKSVAVIASAGTGKTTVLTSRFLDILTRRQVPLTRIVAFTFTEKAAREMKERILKSTELPIADLPQLNVGTIHSFLSRFLRRHGSLAGLAADFVILEEDAFRTWLNHEIHLHVTEALRENEQVVLDFARQYGLSRLTETTGKFLSRRIVLTKPGQTTAQSHETGTDRFLIWCQKLQDMLFEKRIHHQTLCFDDLENLSLQILDNNTLLKTELQQQYTHILLDECQDISPVQDKLIRMLFHPEKNTLFLVGDPKQSIYGFREASTRLFADLVETIRQADGEVISLSKTFRTPQQVQDYFNAVFPTLLNSTGEELYEKAIAEKKDELAAIFAATTPGDGESDFSGERANEVVRLVRRLIDSGADPAEIAILSATRRFFPLLEKSFAQENINIMTDTKSKHFAEDMIALVFHLFLYLAGNREKITQVGLLRSPLLGFSEEIISKLIKQNEADLFALQTAQDQVLEKQDRFGTLCRTLTALKSLSPVLTPAELLESAISRLQQLFTSGSCTAHDIHLLRQFSQILMAWQKQGYTTMNEIYPLLKQWEQSHSEFRPLESGAEGVSLFTIHGAKGLEFDYVILIPSGKAQIEKAPFLYVRDQGLVFKDHDQGHITTLKPKLDKGERYTELAEHVNHLDTQETTRLIYVALTRTQKNLYLFPPKVSSQKLAKLLEKQTAKIFDIKTYNNWLCWLAGHERVKERGGIG